MNSISSVRFAGALLLTAAIAATAPAPAAAQTTLRPQSAARPQPAMGRRNAFHPTPIVDKKNLVRSLRENARFRRDLARHFRVPESRLLAYVDENLRLFALPGDTRTEVWGVDRRGRTFRVRQRLPKGTLVFGLADGTMVLKEICGNPLITYLPPVGSMIPPITFDSPPPLLQGAPPDLSFPASPPVALLPPQPPTTTALLPPYPDDGLPPLLETPGETELFTEIALSEPEAVLGSREVVAAAAGGATGYYVAGGGVVTALLLTGGDEDAGDDLRPPGVGDCDKDKEEPDIVPEPASLALFGGGLLPALPWLLRRRRLGKAPADTACDRPEG